MKRNLLLTLLALGMMGVGSAMAQRSVELLNFGWRFQAGDVENGAAVGLNDEKWRKVNVPYDFQIEQPWVAPAVGEKADNDDPAANIKSRLSSRAFKEMGKGWYRLHLAPADSLK
jgi:beta-galactosidase